MPLTLRLSLPRPVIRPKTRQEVVSRKEYESLYSAVLASKDPGNFKKLVKAVEKGVEYGVTIADDSY
jgi:hypothetical protein